MRTMDVISIDKAAELLLAAIAAIAAGGLLNAPITLFAVSVLKRVVPEAKVSSQMLQFAVGLLLTVLFWIASYFGKVDMFNNVTAFVLAVGPALLNLFAGLTVSSAGYAVAKKANAAVIGYSRS